MGTNKKAPLTMLLSLLLALAALLTACSADSQEQASEEQNPEAEQEIDPDKEVLIYAQTSVMDGFSSVNRGVIDKFNRTHDDVQIVVKDYTNTPTDGNRTEQLRTEIALGQVPDIIDLGGPLPYRQLALKGYLEDLWPYIENDPELGRDGVLEPPLKAAEVDGGLYALFGAVEVETLVGPVDLVGDRTSWTFQELQDAFAAMPEGSTILEFNTCRESMTSTLTRFAVESYVDWETGTCSFDNPTFRSMLEFCKLFPSREEVEAETAAIGDFLAVFDEIDERRWKGLQMLTETCVGVDSLPLQETWFGGRCAFIGYPTADGSVGSIFNPLGPKLAMSSACKNKEAAWEFIRTVLASTPDVGSPIPIKRERYDLQKITAMHVAAIVDIASDGSEIKAPLLSEEQIQRFEDFFNSIDKISMWDGTLGSLVWEIAGPYFAGDKTLDETVDLIQRRVALYVNEAK